MRILHYDVRTLIDANVFLLVILQAIQILHLHGMETLQREVLCLSAHLDIVADVEDHHKRAGKKLPPHLFLPTTNTKPPRKRCNADLWWLPIPKSLEKPPTLETYNGKGYLDEIEVDKNKYKAMLEARPPWNKKDLQSLLGKINFLRRFFANSAGKMRHSLLWWGSNIQKRWYGDQNRRRPSIKSRLPWRILLCWCHHSQEDLRSYT